MTGHPQRRRAAVHAKWAGAAAAAGCLAAAASGAPLEVEFDVKPKAVRLGDMVSATFTVSGADDPPAPELPPLPDFRVSSRPAMGRQTIMSNGRIHTSRTFTYQMMPTKEGTFRIGPIDYEVDGREITLPAVEVRVAPRDAVSAGSGQRLDDLLFARIELSNDDLYVQENAEVLLSVYVAELRLGRDFQLSGLPTSGLSFQSFRDIEGDREYLDGRMYTVRRFRSYVRGLTAGRFEIAPTLTVPLYSTSQRSRRSSSVFDSFFFRDLMSASRPIEVRPPPVTVTIRPLPEAGRPSDFSGAVGQFQFDAQAQPRTVQAGDPITLTLGISGRGNLDAVSAPKLDFGPAFRLYDPRLVSKQINDSLTYGRKSFEQVIIPVREDIEALPQVSFSYFDPESDEYRTLRRGPFHVTVTPGEEAAARVVQAPREEHGAAADVDVLEADIAYLKTQPGRWRNRRPPAWYLRGSFWAVQSLPPLLSAVAFAVARRREGLARDQARSRRARAPRELAGRLPEVQRALEEGRHREFYEALWHALSSYFGDRLNLPPGAVAGPQVVNAFERAGMPSEHLDRLRHLFDLCEQARFGFSPSDQSAMTDSDRRAAGVIFDKLQAVIKQCEKVRM